MGSFCKLHTSFVDVFLQLLEQQFSLWLFVYNSTWCAGKEKKWGEKLQRERGIASEITLALDYLLSLADPPIVHGDVKSVSMLSDNNYTAKIADFGASPLISSGQTIIVKKKNKKPLLASWIHSILWRPI